MVFNKFRFEICGFFAVFLLLCSSFINPCFAAEPEKITIQANWKMGDIFQYRVNQTIKSADKDPFSTEYHVKLAVDEVTDAGSLLTASYIASNVEDTLVFFRKKSTFSPLGLVSFVSQKMPLKIRTDENGSVESLENWKEVAALMLNTIDDLTQLHRDKTSQNILIGFKTQFSTEASTRQQMFKVVSFCLAIMELK